MSDLHINHPVNPAPAGERTWTTSELQQEFDVQGFAAPFVEVTRKSDGQRGTLEFNGQPRVYHTFRAS